MIAIWEKWVFVRLEAESGSGPFRKTPVSEGRILTLHQAAEPSPGEANALLENFLGSGLIDQIRPLGLRNLQWAERRHYSFDCNWKVFVDNYLDGGYHIPHLHKGLDSVLDYSKYVVENGERFCLQSSPMVSVGAESETGAVRKGERALYYSMFPKALATGTEPASTSVNEFRTKTCRFANQCSAD
jgi:hypothetical protein